MICHWASIVLNELNATFFVENFCFNTQKHIPAHLKELVVKKFIFKENTSLELSKTYGVSKPTIYRWLKHFKERNSLNRVYNPKSGQQPKINKVNGDKIIGILIKPASEFGYETDFWTTLRIQQILKKQLKIKVSRKTIYRTLKKIE